MWKKGEMPEQEKSQPQREVPMYVETPAPAAPAPQRTGGQAVIGRSITIRGDVTGDEDLVIQGRVDGSVDLVQHSVTVGPDGQVKANITGRIVTIEGKVEGNLTGEEQVVLRKSSWVQGDVKAPRVVLEDGAHFRGGVLMGEDTAPNRRPAAAPQKTSASSENGKDASLSTHAIPTPSAQAGARTAPAKTADVKG